MLEILCKGSGDATKEGDDEENNGKDNDEDSEDEGGNAGNENRLFAKDKKMA